MNRKLCKAEQIRLKEKLLRAEVSQLDVARRVGYSRSMVSGILNGHHKINEHNIRIVDVIEAVQPVV